MFGNIKKNMLASRPKGSVLDPQGTSELSSSVKAIRIQEKSHIYLCQSQVTCQTPPISSHRVTNYMG